MVVSFEKGCLLGFVRWEMRRSRDGGVAGIPGKSVVSVEAYSDRDVCPIRDACYREDGYGYR